MPNVLDLLHGLLIPSVQDDQMMLALGLVGTTVVPLQSILHSALVCNASETELHFIRKEGAFQLRSVAS